MMFIQTGMEELIFQRIGNVSSAKWAWEILENTYQGTSKVKIAKLQALRRSFENLQMKESESVDHFSANVLNIVNQIRLNGEDLSNQKAIEKVLRSLPRKFDTVVVMIEETKDLSLLSLDDLFGSLIAHESRINKNTDTTLENAFKTHMIIGKGRGRGNFGFRGRERGRNNY